MNTLTEGSATTIDRIQLDWIALTTFEETGNTFSISSYNLQMLDADTGDWDEVVGETSGFFGTSYTKLDLIMGTDYTFRIRASNA